MTPVPAPTDSPWSLDRLGEPVLSLTVFGEPAPQGSKTGRAIYKGKGEARQFTGKVAVQESSKKVKPWRGSVAAIAKAETARIAAESGWLPIDGPIIADMVFTRPKPQRFAANDQRRLHGMVTTTPDLSKLARSTEDALTGIVWTDDSRIVAYRRLDKVYEAAEDADALQQPGAIIRVWVAPVSPWWTL